MSLNSRPFNESLFSTILNQILSKFHQSSSKDIWYCCLALSNEKVPEQMIIASDVYYMIYMRCITIAEEFDLQQISQIGLFMAKGSADGNVPEEFWSGCLENALLQQIQQFKAHSDKISKEEFLQDFTYALHSFAMKKIASKKLMTAVFEMVSDNIE